MATVTRPANRDAEMAASKYVELVRALPQVDRVLLERAPSAYWIWTVIRAEPFDDSAREPVYQAELDALQDELKIPVGFRLVNLAEFPPEDHRSVLPTTATVLFQR
jgi:hypothetical protein